MKALTWHQPYASLVAVGAKRIETRSWSTTYRGPLAIHAAATTQTWDALDAPSIMDDRATIQAVFGALGVLSEDERSWPSPWVDEDGIWIGWDVCLPLGAIVATCELVDVVPTDELDLHLGPERAFRRIAGVESGEDIYACCFENDYGGRAWELDEREQAFGDFTPGRSAWLLDNVKPLDEPIPARGRQRLWNWTQQEAHA